MPSTILIDVCGPHDEIPSDSLVLTVSSRAPFVNPPHWKDLWKLSPLSPVAGGIAVPGLIGVRSRTMENAWQFLKVWPGEEGWRRDDAMAAFDSDCAIRYPRGKGKKPLGHFWGETDEILGYVEARRRIYVPAYLEMLRDVERSEQIHRLRKAAFQQRLVIWDPDSYCISGFGLSTYGDALAFEKKPFAHAFLVALAVEGRLNTVLPHPETETLIEGPHKNNTSD